MRNCLAILLSVAISPAALSMPTFATPAGRFDFAAWAELFEPYVACMRESAAILEPSMEPAEEVATAAEYRCAELLADARMHSDVAVREFNAWAPPENRVPINEAARAIVKVSEQGRRVAVTAVVSLRAQRNAAPSRDP